MDRHERLLLLKLAHLDYILVTNLAIYLIVFGPLIFTSLYQAGVFGSRDLFVHVGKALSTWGKRFPFSLDNAKQAICELQTLTGYMDPTSDNLDIEGEIASLAAPGNQHGIFPKIWPQQFASALDAVSVPTHNKEFLSFQDYVKSAMWLTSGSASIGKVTWTLDEESGSFKARKNMLTQIYTPEELWDIVDGWDCVLRSRVFIKNEMAKLRLAVASNIEAYVTESYMLHLWGHDFKSYQGVTLDETPSEQHTREVSMIKSLQNGAYAFPFDYKAFDHQPTTDEVLAIVDHIAKCVTNNLLPDQQQQFRPIAARIRKSYSNSYLSGNILSQKFSGVQVLGGIPSGVRLTSVVGNLWNSAITYCVKQHVTQILGYDPFISVALRGDDVAILSNNPLALYLTRVVYAAVNAIGEDAKLGISPAVCEFLRNEISVTGVRGWSCRSIGTLTQRKPWNPEPWSPHAEVSTLANNISTLERRSGQPIARLHHANKLKWSKHVKQSYHYLSLPIRLGGFGLYPFGGWVPNRKLPLTTKPLVRTNDLHPSALPSFVTLSESQTSLLAQVEMTAKMQTDDIPGTQKLFSKQWVEDIRRLKITWSVLTMPRAPSRISAPVSPPWDAPLLKRDHAPRDIFRPGAPSFNQLLRMHALLRQVARYDKTFELPSLLQTLEEHYPAATARIRHFEASGWHRTDAITLATGGIPAEPAISIHPILSRYIKEHLLRSGVLYLRGRNRIGLFLSTEGRQSEKAVQLSTMNAMYLY